MIVLELYRRGTISSGKAAELLDMPRLDFIRHASHLGIPHIDMTPDEWEAEKAVGRGPDPICRWLEKPEPPHHHRTSREVDARRAAAQK